MNTKVCNTCGIDKPDTKEYFAVSKRLKDGTETLRDKCKVCKNAEDRARRQEKQQPGQVKPVKEKATEQPIQKQETTNSSLTGDEVILLRKMMKDYKQEPKPKDIILTDEPKSKRLRTTYNLDEDLVRWVRTTARDRGISASDVMNAVLRQLIK